MDFKGQKVTALVDPKDWNIDPEGAYFYYCDNETISGFEFPFVPEGREKFNKKKINKLLK
jgi:phosphoserine aminotransferase